MPLVTLYKGLSHAISHLLFHAISIVASGAGKAEGAVQVRSGVTNQEHIQKESSGCHF